MQRWNQSTYEGKIKEEKVKEKWEGKRKVYTLTPKGQEVLQTVKMKKLSPEFKKLFLKFMYHLEHLDWGNENHLPQLLQDLRTMESYLQNFFPKEDRYE